MADEQKQVPLVEYMVRVKLPNPAGYHCSPSGDSEYEDAYRQAISEARPPGFEVRWPRAGQKWAVDSEGYTLVPLYLAGKEEALDYWMAEYQRAAKWIARVRDAVKLPLG